MTRLSRYLRESGGGGPFLTCLLSTVKVLNTALLLSGVALTACAGYIVINALPEGGSLAALPGPVLATAGVLGGFGVGLAGAALAALLASSLHSMLLLNTHMLLMALILAGQVCMAAAVLSPGRPEPNQRVSWLASGQHPDGRTGSAAAMTTDAESAAGGAEGFLSGGLAADSDAARAAAAAVAAAAAAGGGVRQQLRDLLMASKWADIALVSLEVATLLAACALHSAYTRADGVAEDMEEGLADASVPFLTSRSREARRGAGRASPGPAGRTQLPPRVQRDDEWSQRMRQQYGLDTSVLTYDPQARAQRQRAGEVGGVQAGAQQGGAAAAGSSAARGCIVS